MTNLILLWQIMVETLFGRYTWDRGVDVHMLNMKGKTTIDTLLGLTVKVKLEEIVDKSTVFRKVKSEND